ncbi:sensor histidine kinase [Caldinitratiruptor microaerophilus]|uniref:histidine kinase n=1 Tax=Caldinitratiruptor microaerophilus TaxID=671077 RepID=A0AA35G8A4_9FIRM|nr:HAMP domain-containing sensor histidine kinase [Caldinitratiruptor microaerophilus]BDG59074.1 PAS domain-containing sensor histidine kinase [Caldinitratiruptor microaerophilus]
MSRSLGSRLLLTHALAGLGAAAVVAGSTLVLADVPRGDPAGRRLAAAAGASALVATAGAAALGARVARRLQGVLAEMARAVDALARGEPGRRVYADLPDAEVRSLARALNHAARRMEEHLEAAQAERDLLDTVLDQMPVGVVYVDRTGAVARSNPAADRFLGLSPADRGRHHVEALRQTALSGAVDAALGGRPARVTIRREGPPARWLEASATPGHGPGGGAILVLHDITEARRVEAVRRDLIANVSHELKTPVTAIRGFAETLLQGALEEPGDARRFVQIIDAEARRLSDLVQELLDLARLESDPQAIRPVPTDLARLVREAAARLRPRAEEAGLELAVEAPATLPAPADPRRIDQALTNLVENSVQHTPRGGRITIRAQAIPEGVHIAVIDTGTGIPPEALPRIFERFYRVERGRERTTGGTGLGLAIVKHIVEGHGGRVWAESRPGEGTAIHFVLPAAGTGQGAGVLIES